MQSYPHNICKTTITCAQNHNIINWPVWITVDLWEYLFHKVLVRSIYLYILYVVYVLCMWSGNSQQHVCGTLSFTSWIEYDKTFLSSLELAIVHVQVIVLHVCSVFTLQTRSLWLLLQDLKYEHTCKQIFYNQEMTLLPIEYLVYCLPLWDGFTFSVPSALA